MKLSTMDKGGLLAAANVIVVAALVTTLAPSGVAAELAFYSGPSQFGLVIASALLPALLVGALLARLGASMVATRGWRSLVLMTFAVGAVLVFGGISGMPGLIPYALPSTVVFTRCLERWTRPLGRVRGVRFV